MNKKYLFGLMALFAVTIVSAGYLVSSFVITTDVYEPFEVEYAIIGDAGNWNGQETCDEYDGAWEFGEDVDVGGLYAGEGRVACAKITNLGEGDVTYRFEAEVTSGFEGNLADCIAAFQTVPAEGTVTDKGTVSAGINLVIAGDAIPLDNCGITLSVIRGVDLTV